MSLDLVVLLSLAALAVVLLLLSLGARRRRRSRRDTQAVVTSANQPSQLVRRALPHAARQFLSAAIQSGARVIVVGARSEPTLALARAFSSLGEAGGRIMAFQRPADLLRYLSGDAASIAFVEATEPSAAMRWVRSLYASGRPMLAEPALAHALADGIDLLVWIGVTPGGIALVREVSQPAVVRPGTRNARIVVEPIFGWTNAARELRPAGVRPRALERMAEAGIRVPDHLFEYRGLGAG